MTTPSTFGRRTAIKMGLAGTAAVLVPRRARAQSPREVKIALVVPLSGAWARQGILKQMGAESLTTATVRRIVNVQREPVVTVRFRQPGGREILSCWGDSKVLEDASVNGRYTLMCTASSGAQRQMEVVTSGEP